MAECIPALKSVCDVGDAIGKATQLEFNAGTGLVKGTVQAIAFSQDPLGWLVQKMQEGIHGIGAVMIPYALKVLEPDYSLEWWRDSYAISFGVAILILAFILIAVTVRRVRGDIGPKAIVQSFFYAVPAFIIFAFAGPILGAAVTKFFVGLSSALAVNLLDTTTGDFYTSLADRASSGDAAKLVGSAMISMLVLSILFLALIGVFFILVVQVATQYLIGALIPLGLVWMAHPDTRHNAKVGPLIWVSILASHVLLILVLGYAFKAIDGLLLKATDDAISDPMRTFVNLAVPTVLMAMVVFAPMGLMRLAKFTKPGGGGGQSRSGGLSTPNQAPQPGRQVLNAQQTADNQSRSAERRASNEPSSDAPATMSSQAASTGRRAGTEAASTAGKGATVAGGGAAAGGGMATAGAAATATGVGAPLGMSMLILDAAVKVAHHASKAAEQAAHQAADAGDHREN
ncbi:hypothetical protein [Clavibacter sp. VKM Ac-2872]|uniref:hypothetical protein n=1 Tax=Clavibacter sp. VKM Ac-2872 TaxID=2783812 RepID=UPI00188D7EA2|nr:hypothetical protein [Clavibacter sp. VKM Ac-2872]MBF4625843.1 hypothetical protein [Clavibacter sp. VKM Ac-2872]